MSGKHQGQRGEVKQVLRKANKVVVEGVNLVIKHQAGTEEVRGGKYTKEAAMDVSKVALIDPQDDKPCKTRWVYLEGGEKARQSKRTGAIIPKNELTLLAYKRQK